MTPPLVRGYKPSEYHALRASTTNWLLKPILPRGGTAIVVGSPKAGKSSLAVQIMLSLAAGKDFLDFPNTTKGRTAYVQLDNPRELWKERLALTDEYLFEDDIFHIDRESAPYPFNIRLAEHGMGLAEALKAFGPDLVVVDTLRESFRGDENDSDVMQQVISSFRAVCGQSAILYVHHGKKPPTDPLYESDTIDSGRGSSYVPGAVDTFMSLRAQAPVIDRTTGHEIVKGTLSFKGRALSEGKTKLVQDPKTFLWRLPEEAVDPFQAALIEIIANDSYETDKDRAQVLADTFGRSAAACQVAISRHRNHK